MLEYYESLYFKTYPCQSQVKLLKTYISALRRLSTLQFIGWKLHILFVLKNGYRMVRILWTKLNWNPPYHTCINLAAPVAKLRNKVPFEF